MLSSNLQISGVKNDKIALSSDLQILKAGSSKFPKFATFSRQENTKGAPYLNSFGLEPCWGGGRGKAIIAVIHHL